MCYKLYTKYWIKIKKIIETFLDETQSGFRNRRSCFDSAFTSKVTLEKKREYNLHIHFLFLDYEKAFEEVRRMLLFSILKRKIFLAHYLQQL